MEEHENPPPLTESSTDGSAEGGSDGVIRTPQSCMHILDALWFCYSPVYQARRYYMDGEFDNCRGRLKRFRMCVMSRFQDRKISEALFENEEKKTKVVREPVWELREEYIKRQQEDEQKRQNAAKDHIKSGDDNGWWL